MRALQRIFTIFAGAKMRENPFAAAVVRTGFARADSPRSALRNGVAAPRHSLPLRDRFAARSGGSPREQSILVHSEKIFLESENSALAGERDADPHLAHSRGRQPPHSRSEYSFGNQAAGRALPAKERAP